MPDDGPSILKTALLDLLHELRDADVPLVLGGGYGLYLRQLHLQEVAGRRSLFDAGLWPRPRATEDLDFLLRTEVVADTNRMARIRRALDRLGYKPIPGAEFMQFKMDLGQGRFVKIDLLTGPLGEFGGDPRIKMDARRVRSRTRAGLHAHRTDEAIAFSETPYEIALDGLLSNGELYSSVVPILQPFTYMLMKLFAFRDRRDDPAKDFARHHALDLYRIVAMLTETEYDAVGQRVSEHHQDPVLAEARDIVRRDFASEDSLGTLRLREHGLFTADMDVDGFLSALHDLLGV